VTRAMSKSQKRALRDKLRRQAADKFAAICALSATGRAVCIGPYGHMRICTEAGEVVQRSSFRGTRVQQWIEMCHMQLIHIVDETWVPECPKTPLQLLAEQT
jgi:hypothetical protein